MACLLFQFDTLWWEFDAGVILMWYPYVYTPSVSAVWLGPAQPVPAAWFPPGSWPPTAWTDPPADGSYNSTRGRDSKQELFFQKFVNDWEQNIIIHFFKKNLLHVLLSFIKRMCALLYVFSHSELMLCHNFLSTALLVVHELILVFLE